MDEAKVCGQLRRNDSGDPVECGAQATHTVITPYNAQKLVCKDCARAYAVTAGFLVAPSEDICDTCKRLDPKADYGFHCWCGFTGDSVRRYNVDGLWYTLCPVHKPVPIALLWVRLRQRFAWRLGRIFRPLKQPSAAEIIELTETTRRRAKR
jgi:hypothetical protein